MNGLASPDDALRHAQELYDAERLEEAEVALKQVIADDPSVLVAYLLLGAIAGRSNRDADAVAWLERARDIDPASSDAWKGLGLVYRRQGRADDAIAAYERALALAPGDADTHVNLAVALKAIGNIDAAIDHLQRAIARAPRLSAAYFNLGNCLLEQGDLDRAGAAYFECVKINPRDAPAIIGMAKVFHEQRRFDMAEKTLNAAIKLMPDNADIRATLGALFHDTGRMPEGQAILQAVLKTQPRNFRALRYLGNLKRDLGDVASAERLYRQALEVEPENADALFELSAALAELGQRPAALEVLDRIGRLYPASASIRYRRALALLNEGELSQGWAEYGQTIEHRDTRFAHLPKLEALSFARRKVIVWGNQGIGDEIIYGSFLQDLRQHAPNIVCEIDRRLAPLFRREFTEMAFVERGFQPDLPRSASGDAVTRAWRLAPLDPRFAGATHQVALPDLGQWLRPSFVSFPAHSGYLRADPERIAAHRQALALQRREPLVGLSWRSRNKDFSHYKSIDLRAIVDALPTGPLRLVNLQYGDVKEEIAAVARATSRRVEIVPGLDYFNDIEGLAALVMACDVVITVSNVTAHLAGSLGKRAALLCPRHGKPWYWFRDRAESPWYPSLRIFRQAPDGCWAGALAAAMRYALSG